MVKNLALAAIVGLFAASVVVAAPEGKKEDTTVPAEADASKAKEGMEKKDEKPEAAPAPTGK